MLELNGNILNFKFPEVHANAQVGIDLQRTIRIPDDGKSYPLPPGLGTFPTKMVDDPKCKDRVPAKWLEHGGVMLPMYQAEAMWIQFKPHTVYDRDSAYPFAIKISAGMKSCITGETRAAVLKEKDYVVVPGQPWLDGFVVEKGKIRQFIAAPLGMGFTAEEQLSGKAEFGGLQVEVFPMKAEVYEKKFPVRPTRDYMNYSCDFNDGDGPVYGTYYGGPVACAAAPAAMSMESTKAMPMRSRLSAKTASLNPDMGLGAGGTMTQQIFEDKFELSDWDIDHRERCFIHLANSLAWQAITGYAPPPCPANAEMYKKYRYPWFDYYRDDLQALEATGALAGLKSVLELGFQKGFHILPDNESVEIKPEEVNVLTAKPTPERGEAEVKDGVWNE